MQEFDFDLFLLQGSKQQRSMKTAMATMRRVGAQLLDERKQRFLSEKSDAATADEDDAGLQGRDLLSLLVKANMDPDMPETQRMCDEDVLARM